MSSSRSGDSIPATSNSCWVTASAGLPSDAATSPTVDGNGSFQAM